MKLSYFLGFRKEKDLEIVEKQYMTTYIFNILLFLLVIVITTHTRLFDWIELFLNTCNTFLLQFKFMPYKIFVTFFVISNNFFWSYIACWEKSRAEADANYAKQESKVPN